MKATAAKVGARNNASDKQTIQAIHDNACDLGADCKPMDMNEGITAMLMNKKIDFKALKSMGALEYAQQERWDIQTTCSAITMLTQLYDFQNGEAEHIADLAKIMVDLGNFLIAEIQEMTAAAGSADAQAEIAEEAAEEAGTEITANYNGDVLFKSTSLKKLPDSDFLVVDKDGQHLQVKENGKPDHRLMGAAWAALHEGYRGNKYEGSDKGKALDKLKALYKEEKMDLPSEGKSLNLSYAKSLGIVVPEMAVKFTAKDEIKGYTFLWGNEKLTDLEVEYFTKSTDFWDSVMGKNPRPLTWDHAQDATFKASPVIGQITDFGDDEIGRWYVAKLDRSHQYNKAIAELIKAGKLGTSSDSAPQYVERVKTGKATWLKTWAWFASALTDTPAEPRMIGSLEILKSLGIELPDTNIKKWQNYQAVSEYMKTKYQIGD